MLRNIIISFYITLSITTNAQEKKLLVPIIQNNRWGAIDLNHKEIIPFKYNNINLYTNNTYLVTKDSLKGLYNSKGEKILDCKYNSIKPLNEDTFIVLLNKNKGIVKENDRIIIPIEYNSIYTNKNQDYYIIKNKIGKSAMYSKSGKQIIPFEFDNISFYDDDKLILTKNHKYALAINNNYYEIKYHDNITKFGSGFLVTHKGKQGYLSEKGIETITCKYEDIKLLEDKYLIVKKNSDKGAFFSKDGERISKYRYSEPFYYFNNKTVWTKKDKQWISFDFDTKEESFIELDRVLDKQKGYLRIVKNNYLTLINKNGEELFSNTYHDIIPLDSGLFKVQFDRKWGVIDILGNNIIPIAYDNIILNEKLVNNAFEERFEIQKSDENTNLYSKLIIAKKSNKFGVFSTNGIEIVPVEYDEVGVSQTDKLIWVRIKDKYGVYNRKGIQIISPNLPNISWNEFQKKLTVIDSASFRIINTSGTSITINNISNIEWSNKKDLFYTKENNKIGLLNIKGDTLIKCKYEELYDFDKNLILGKKDNRIFIFDKTGNPLGSTNFKLIFPPKKFNNNIFYIAVNTIGRTGVINSKGDVIIPFEYDEILFKKIGLFRIINKHKFIGYYNVKGEKFFK